MSLPLVKQGFTYRIVILEHSAKNELFSTYRYSSKPIKN